jgi:hypothetical protein
MAPAGQAIFEQYNLQAERLGWTSRVDPSLDFAAFELREALAVWRLAAHGRALPLRTALTPRLMKRFLQYVALVDIVRSAGRTRFRVRLTGTGLEKTFGGLSGTFLDESLPEPLCVRWVATLNVPLLVQGPVRSFGRIAFRDQTYLSIETFYGPMGADIESPDALLLVVHVEPNSKMTKRVIENASLLDTMTV